MCSAADHLLLLSYQPTVASYLPTDLSPTLLQHFKAVFALYFAAITLTALGRLIGIDSVGKLHMKSCPSMLCTSLSNVESDNNDIIEDIVNNVDLY